MDSTARGAADVASPSAGDPLLEQIRGRYASAARMVMDGGPSTGCCGPAGECCGTASTSQSTGLAAPACCGPNVSEKASFGSILYAATDTAALPESAVLASLGCGNPLAVADLRPGETVLDLGSGGGIDVLLSAARVGPAGRAIGLDMTDEMLQLARRNAAEAGATNVEFRKGRIEAIPVADDSVDVVISNCVVNLSTDKAAVFREVARVLRPGGRIGISDVVARDDLSPADRAARGSYVGCIAGALSFAEYEAGLEAVGLTSISVRPTHQAADGMFGAIVRATKPASAPTPSKGGDET